MRTATAPLPLPAPIAIDAPRYPMRTLRVEDATDRWPAWYADREIRSLLNLAKPPQSKADMVAYIRSFDQRQDLLLGIFDKANDLLVGILSLYIDWPQKMFTANMIIGESAYRSKGVTMEITPPFRDYFFETRGLEVMTATALANNKPIRAYLEKTGWTLEKVLKAHVRAHDSGAMLDLCCYSITRAAWRVWKAKHLPAPGSG